jgi:hypothetical protein
MAPTRKDNIEYHSLTLPSRHGSQTLEEDSLRPEMELGQVPEALAYPRSWKATWAIQIACLLWAAPVVTLLVLNFKGHIVGASAFCPKGKCEVGWFNLRSIAEDNLYRFDRHDHNLLGVLQLVAKALEIW